MKPEAIDALINVGISSRKIHPGQREQWRQMFEQAPDRTARLLADTPQSVFNEAGQEEAYQRYAERTLKIDPSSVI